MSEDRTESAAQERYERLKEGARQGDEFDMLCLALSNLLGIGTAANEEEGLDELYCLAEQSGEYANGETIFIEPRLLAVQLNIILQELLPDKNLFTIPPDYLIEQASDE